MVSVAAALLVGATAIGPPVLEYEGLASALSDGRTLYRETHFVFEENGERHRLVLYRCPSGAPFARKLVTYGADPLAPSFELVDERAGYREGLRRTVTGTEVFFDKTRLGRSRRARLPEGEAFVADAGFDEFVRLNWDLLARAGDTELAFLVPSRLATARFRVTRLGSERLSDGEDATRFRLAVTGFFSWFAPTIDVLYRDRDRWLVRYEGITNIRDRRGRNLSARIEFDEAPRMVSRTRLDQARRLILVDDCG